MTKDINYRQLSQELDSIIDSLQNGDLQIDEAIKQYERGMTLVKLLQSYLEDAENKVTKIKQSFDK